MGAQLRVYRRRIRSVQATKKITRAMELIAASRIVKAQARVASARPYAVELRRAVSAAASQSSTIDHPLLASGKDAVRSALLVVTADRGLAGAYSSNALKEGEALTALLKEEGKEAVNFLYGRKGVAFYRFRNRPIAAEWTGQTDAPTYEQAREIADALLAAYNTPAEEGGVDEIHLVYTRFLNMGTQVAAALRILPLEVVEEEVDASAPVELSALYEFEPSAESVLDALLPQYIAQLVWSCLLESAASEHAARRRAMKSATDNAEELIKSLTRAANSARQAEITQEISEIVGGADALSSAGNE
jgi:F-type H+-transporting ATPase subunit gamma